VKALQIWFKASFGKLFKNRGNYLAHAVQEDSFSCGIIAVNTLEHAIFGQPLWKGHNATKERLAWFKRMALTAVKAEENKQAYASKPLLQTQTHAETSNDTARRKPRNIADLLNPINDDSIGTTPPRDYNSDSSFCSVNDASDIEEDMEANFDGQSVATSHPSSYYPNSSMSSLPISSQAAESFAESIMDVDYADSSPSPSHRSSPGGDPSNQSQSRKRERSESPEYDGYSEDSKGSADEDLKRAGRKYIKAGEGQSRSATASFALRKAAASGILKINKNRQGNWQAKIRKADQEAEFESDNVSKTRCSLCREWVLAKEPYDSTRFKKHAKKCKEKCKEKQVKGRTPNILSMGWFTKSKNSEKSSKQRERGGGSAEEDDDEEITRPTVPCPGLTEVNDPRVKQYLKRTGAAGGGGRSLPVIAKELFGKLFSKLQKTNSKKTVVNQQIHEWTWRNDHAHLCVFSTACEKAVIDRSPKPPLPCSECSHVLRSRQFRNIIHRSIPSDKNARFINHRFRNPLLGALYAKIVGVRELVEDEVHFLHFGVLNQLLIT